MMGKKKGFSEEHLVILIGHLDLISVTALSPNPEISCYPPHTPTPSPSHSHRPQHFALNTGRCGFLNQTSARATNW